ncbi:MAG: hypothetical protein CM1200mP36_05180 [Gammaproteobacteria bacterium]|nr:MAG: hypothetical protein CM1200mP36_05180 [Gammaproteobacteria bacterium]
MLDYQRSRVVAFLILNPTRWEPAKHHSVENSARFGGLFGKGWLNGTQAHLEFLPERSTDFIFAVMGEELGLLGCWFCLGLPPFGRQGSIHRGQAQDTFTRLLAGGLSLTFFVYVFVNAGMVCGLLPIVGVPLSARQRWRYFYGHSDGGFRYPRRDSR